ncbi:MAG: hypothetical protein WA705_25655 [Candidatus Ozemobacteraceae bacterium]
MNRKMVKLAIFSLLFLGSSISVFGAGDPTANYLKELAGSRHVSLAPINGREWCIGKNDLTWDQAAAWIKSLGRGWTIPTRGELSELFKAGSEINAINAIQSNCIWAVLLKGEYRMTVLGRKPAPSTEWGRFYFFLGREEWDNRVTANAFGPLTGQAVAVRAR